MSSRRAKLKSAKSLPDLKVAKSMPTASQAQAASAKTRQNGVKPHRTLPEKLPYREEQYSSKVLTGGWQERRIIDSLPKDIPFEDAYMLGERSSRRPASATRLEVKKAPSADYTRDAINHAYSVSRAQALRNKKTFSSESPEDIHHPQPGTPQHDQGAAWHSLYYQTYTLRNPRITGSQVHVHSVDAPEMKYGLLDKQKEKWAKQKAEDADVAWKSTYQKTYPETARMPEVERKFVNSQWRTRQGEIVIGNPHLEGTQREPDSVARGQTPTKPRGPTPC